MCKQAYFGLILSAIASVLVVPSCSFEEQEINSCDEDFSFIAEQLDTRAYLDVNDFNDGAVTFKWETDDEVGVFGYYTNNAKFTTTASATTAVFSGRIVSGDRVRYAYYPYTNQAVSYRSVPANVPTLQYYNNVESLAENVIRASNRASTTRSGRVSFNFSTLVSVVKLNIDLSALAQIGSNEVITGVKIVDETGANIAGDYQVNLSNLSMTASNATNEVYVQVPDPYVSDGLYTCAAIVAPGIRSGDRIGVTIETDLHQVYKSITCNKNYSAGQLYTLDCVMTSSTAGVEVSNRTFDDTDRVYGLHADWVDGFAISVGGAEFDIATSNLSDYGFTEDQTINDSSLENAIVFVNEGVTLTLGPDATVGNTLILCNNEGAKANLVGTLRSTGSGSFVAVADMNVSGGVVAGSSLSALVFDGCSVTVPSTDGCFLSTSGATLNTLALTGNVFHSADASSNATYSLLDNASSVALGSLVIKDNTFLNVDANSALISPSSVNFVTLENNHLNYSSDLANSFAIVATSSVARDMSVSNNSFYAPSGDGSITACTVGTASTPAGKAVVNPLSSVDVAAGEYTIGQYLAAATYNFDGSTKNCGVSGTGTTYGLKHAQDDVQLDLFAMPGVTYTESGDLGSIFSVACELDGDTQTYSFNLPDYVESSTIQSLSSLSGTWVTQWADEFNSSDWDREVWTRCPQSTPDWAKAQWPDDETLVTVEGGSLVTYARKDDDTSKGLNGYITGGIWGNGLKSFNLGNGVAGRIDIRAKMTSATGYWPAIWMMPDQQGFAWPEWGEIDIMEHLNSDSVYYTTLHTSQSDSGDHKCSATKSLSTTSSWHVYSVIVADDTLYTLVDGVVVLTCKASDHGVTSSSTSDYLKNYWPYASTNYYLIMDSQLGGGWVGSPDGTGLPAHMDIDYVRYMVRQ